MCTGEMDSLCPHKDLHKSVPRAILHKSPKTPRQPKCPSTGKWENKVGCTRRQKRMTECPWAANTGGALGGAGQSNLQFMLSRQRRLLRSTSCTHLQGAQERRPGTSRACVGWGFFGADENILGRLSGPDSSAVIDPCRPRSYFTSLLLKQHSLLLSMVPTSTRWLKKHPTKQESLFANSDISLEA